MTNRFNISDQNSNTGKPQKLKAAAADDWNDDVLFRIKDPALAQRIRKQMRARLDLEEVMNDPDLKKTRIAAAKMVDDHKVAANESEGSRFIKDVLAGKKSVSKNPVIEIGKSDINELSAEWVKEWHRKQQMQVQPTPEEQERKNFISSSMEADITEQAEVSDSPVKRKRFLYKYVSLAAAVIIGALFLIRVLVPVSEEALFSSYYKPFDALPSITRSGGGPEADLFSRALDNYRKENYAEAGQQFSGSINSSRGYDQAIFFLGLTELARGNYDKAVPHLESAILNDEQYRKDAQWYLGLACLKNGRKEKALNCFEELSKENGFYSVRAGKIHRRIR